jgi:hypothetical protein
MDILYHLLAKQNQADPYGYASWLLTVQILNKLLTKGYFSSEDAKKIIERAVELAYLNPFAPPDTMEAIFGVTCELLGLPHDASKSEESEDTSTDT